jgi:dipeptidyl aminopeptidase/acylaminoacyl peptidase
VAVDPLTGKSSGELERLTQDRIDNWYASVSPDSRKVAYLSQQNGRVAISMMDADGANERTLLDRSPGLSEPIWRSESELLFWNPAAPGQAMGPRTLQSVDLKTGMTREATIVPAIEGKRGPWPSNGYLRVRDELVYVSDPNATGSVTIRARRLSDGVERVFATLQGAGFLAGFLVSPDGKRMAYLFDANPTTGECKPCEFGVLDVETGEKRPLPAPMRTHPLVSWSPDGRFFLYGSVRPRVMDTTTGTSWVLIDEATQTVPEGVSLQSWGEDAGAAWAPNGQFIVLSLGGTQSEWRRWSGVTAESLAKAAAGREVRR